MAKRADGMASLKVSKKRQFSKFRAINVDDQAGHLTVPSFAPDEMHGVR
jgi:hypothetical protein